MVRSEELLEKNSRFFSNTNIYIDYGNVDRITYKKNERDEIQNVFITPRHTLNTTSLLVFKDGKLQIKDRDYEDIDSTHIRFIEGVDTNIDVDIILISSGDPMYSGDVNWEEF